MKNELKVLVGDFQRRYDVLDVDQQRKLRVMTARILSVGTAVTMTTAIYSFVPLGVRLFALPLFVVASWYVSGKVASGDWPVAESAAENGLFGRLVDRLKHAPTLAVLGAFMMVAFLFAGLIWGAR